MIFLNCPFNEKDECKALGGKWDAERKKWYVPDGVDASSFQKWIESDKKEEILAPVSYTHLTLPTILRV